MEKSDIEEEIKMWVNEHDLVAEVYDKNKSWHFPNETYLVVIILSNV